MISTSEWPETKIIVNQKFCDARDEAHNALFWMARATNSFLEPMTQNGHLSLFWHAGSGNFRTKIFDQDLQIGLNIEDLELYFCEHEMKVPHSFFLDDHTPAFVEAWYLVELLHREVDQSKFSTKLPFESPVMLMGDTQEHMASLYKEELRALNQCLVKSFCLFEELSKFFVKNKKFLDFETKISLEPESFSLELKLVSLAEKNETIIIGFCFGDYLRPVPFFFVNNQANLPRAKSRVLDFRPETMLVLTSIAEKALSDECIITKLYGHAIDLTDSK